MKPLRPDNRTVGHCSGDVLQKRFETDLRHTITRTGCGVKEIGLCGARVAYSQFLIISMTHLKPIEHINNGQS
jgi:hypothetical protein